MPRDTHIDVIGGIIFYRSLSLSLSISLVLTLSVSISRHCVYYTVHKYREFSVDMDWWLTM